MPVPKPGLNALLEWITNREKREIRSGPWSIWPKEEEEVLSELNYVDRRSNREDRSRLDRGGFGEVPLCVQGYDLQACGNRSGWERVCDLIRGLWRNGCEACSSRGVLKTRSQTKITDERAGSSLPRSPFTVTYLQITSGLPVIRPWSFIANLSMPGDWLSR